MAGPRDLIVRFLADTAGFLKGTDDIAGAYRDMASQSERAAGSGEDDAERLARAYRDAAADMGKGAQGGAQDFVDQTTRVVDKGQSAIKKVAGKQMKSLGKSLAGDLSNGIQGFNPADLGGSIGSVLGSITAANPLIAGALALGGLAASQILGGMSKTTESAKQTGREIYQAMLDGVIEMKEREGIVAKAMGVEDFTAAQAAIADIAAKMGVPAADLQAQFLGLGEVTMPTVEAAMVKVREQIQQGVLASDPMAGKYTDAYDAAVAVSGTMGKITTQWGIQGGAIANNTSAVKKLNAALLVQEQTMIRIGYGPGSATYRSQVPAYTTGTRSPTS